MIGSHISHLMQEHKDNPCIIDLCETIVQMEHDRDKAESEARDWQRIAEYRLEELIRIQLNPPNAKITGPGEPTQGEQK